MPPTTAAVDGSEDMDFDITEKFTRAASALVTGELVKDEYFTLFEAVGALEIMDSKMDSGYLAPGETLDHNYDVMRALLPEEVLGIMDQLLCHEVAWHMGHPLSQTLFTSIYLDRLLWPIPKSLDETRFNARSSPDPDNGSGEAGGIVDIVLRAYCISLIKACGYVHARITAEFYYEEEDFSTQLYGRKLFPDDKPEEIIAALNEAIEWLNNAGQHIAEDIRVAIRNRLVFRLHFLKFLSSDITLSQSRSTDNLSSMLDQVNLIEKSLPLGKPVEDAFSEKIQRRLASTVPPRPIIGTDTKRTIAYLKRFWEDAIGLQDVLDSNSTFTLYNLLWTLQSRKPQPCVYIRSLAQSLLLHDSQVLGTMSPRGFCSGSVKDLVLPFSPLFDPKSEKAESPSHPDFEVFQYMNDFIARMSQPFIDLYRTTCLNRCRVRRTLCHNILDWDRLQAEAEECDNQLSTWDFETPLYINEEPTYPYSFSSWAYHLKLQQMRLVVQLGFELSIYSPEEYQGMYWYISHISSAHLVHLDRIRACVISEAEKSLSQSGGKSRTDIEDDIRARERTFTLLDRLSTELGVIDAFSIALHALYTLLSRHNLIKLDCTSSPGYSSANLRYELRMKPFLPISLPEVVPFDIYEREATMAGKSDQMVLKRAVRAISETKKGLERYLADGPYLTPEERPSKTASSLEADWIENTKNMIRASIATSIAVDVFKKALSSKDESSPINLSVTIPEIGSPSRRHDWWAVPQISEVLPLRGPKKTTI